MSSETRSDVSQHTALPLSHPLLPVAVVTVAGLLARVYGLAGRQLPTDEAITLAFVQQFSVLELVTQLPVLQPHFPTYYLVLDAWLSLVGVTATNARVLSAIAGILTIPVIYWLGTELHSRRAGLLAATLCAISPYHIALSQVIRMYALLGLLAAVAWLALLRDRPTIYAGSAIGVVYLHYFGILVIAGQWLYLAWTRRHRLSRSWQQAIGSVALAALPGIAWIGHRTTTETAGSNVRVVGLKPPTLAEFARTPFQFVLGDLTLGTGHFLALCVLVGAGYFTVHVARHRDVAGWRPSQLGLFLGGGLMLPVIVLFAVSHLLKPVFRARYLVMAALALYILAGVGLARLPRRRQLVVASVLLLSTIAAMPAAYATSPSEWRAADDYLTENVDDADGVVLVGLFGREAMIREQQLDVGVVESRKALQHVPPDTLQGFEDVFVVRYDYWGQTRPSLAAVGVADSHRIAGETRISGNLVIYRVRHDTTRRPVA